MKTTHPTTRMLVLGFLGILLATAAFIYVYQVYPLPGIWNDIVINSSYCVAAVLAAWISLRIWRMFGKDEAPRRMWFNLGVGLACWATAELFWTLYTLVGEVPDISLADVPWVFGYAFFAVAFISQYRLIHVSKPSQERKWLAFSIAGTLLVAIIVTILLRKLSGHSDQSFAETYLLVFYPIADLALAIGVICLARIFRRGLWGRIWLSFLVFVFSDGLYSILVFSGLYTQFVESGNMLSMVSDVLYLDAYLLIWLVAYAQFLLLKHGPPSVPTQKIEIGVTS